MTIEVIMAAVACVGGFVSAIGVVWVSLLRTRLDRRAQAIEYSRARMEKERVKIDQGVALIDGYAKIVDDMQMRITYLTEELERQRQRVTVLERERIELLERIDGLERERAELRERIRELETDKKY